MGSVGGLRDLLQRAMQEADGLGGGPAAVPPVAQRPGYFAPQDSNDLDEVVERLACVDAPITFVVGAGASMEAGLPSWASLVREMLEEVSPDLSDSDKPIWLDAIDDGGLLAAAAIARVMCTDEARFRELLWRKLYRDRGVDYFVPGPLTRELAAFKQAFSEVQLVTFNYDGLLEQALRDLGLRAEARYDDSPERERGAVVRHLHGRLDDRRRRDPVVLTEADYARFPAQDGWQSRTMHAALDGICVFVGLSFNDPNLLRWVYGSGERRHLALLTRQSSPQLGAEVRRELEIATRARLQAAGVDAYWSDFYGELAQVIHEARRRRAGGRRLRPFPQRAKARAEVGRRRCLPGGSAFATRQRAVRELLQTLLEIVRAVGETAGTDLADEHLGLALWGADHDNREVSLWASSDRLHADGRSIVPIPLSFASDWVAVETVTQCNAIARDPNVYASRWRFVRGTPLVWTGDEEDRIVVGAVTLTSTASDSALAQLPDPAKRTIDAHLQSHLVRLWA